MKQSRQCKTHADAIKYLSVINETEGMSQDLIAWPNYGPSLGSFLGCSEREEV